MTATPSYYSNQVCKLLKVIVSLILFYVFKGYSGIMPPLANINRVNMIHRSDIKLSTLLINSQNNHKTIQLKLLKFSSKVGWISWLATKWNRKMKSTRAEVCQKMEIYVELLTLTRGRVSSPEAIPSLSTSSTPLYQNSVVSTRLMSSSTRIYI